MDIMDMFPDRVSPEPNSGCWLWTGGLKDGKYGSARGDYAHRLSSVLVDGPLPMGVSVLHRCDTHLCVNPDHLYRGDQWDNMADMSIRDRSRSHVRSNTVREIRDLYASGRYSQTDLSRLYGIGQTTVSGITRGARRRLVE